MIVAEDQRRVFGEPFFGALMHGVVETLTATRFHVVVVVARSGHDRVWLEHYVAGGHLDGVMLIAPPKGDPLTATLNRLGCADGVHRPAVRGHRLHVRRR